MVGPSNWLLFAIIITFYVVAVSCQLAAEFYSDTIFSTQNLFFT